MKPTVILVAASLVLVPALVAENSNARAGMLCAPRDDLRIDLAQRFGEVPVARGVVGDHHVIEVFAAPSGSFTVVVTRPGALACVIAAGEGWQKVAAPPSKGGGA